MSNQGYTITQDAYLSLIELMKPHPAILKDTSKDTQYEWSGFDNTTIISLSLHSPPTPRTMLGLSHALTTIAYHHPIDEWEDTRPDDVIDTHATQLDPSIMYTTTSNPNTTIKHARSYYAMQRYQSYRAEWFDRFSDSPKQQRHLDLSLHAQSYYYHLAILHKMSPRHRGGRPPKNRPAYGPYISVALEAIGLHYLTPPSSYMTTIMNNPNLSVTEAARVAWEAAATTQHQHQHQHPHHTNTHTHTPALIDLNKYKPIKHTTDTTPHVP